MTVSVFTFELYKGPRLYIRIFGIKPQVISCLVCIKIPFYSKIRFLSDLHDFDMKTLCAGFNTLSENSTTLVIT